MKKIVWIISIILILISIGACRDSTSLDASVKFTTIDNPYFPTDPGDYWIYEVDENGTKYIDSVVVTGARNINGIDAIEFTTYRNNTLLNKSYYSIANNSIKLYASILEPLLDTLDCGCNYKFKQRWITIAKFGSDLNDVNTIRQLDSSDRTNYKYTDSTKYGNRANIAGAYNILDFSLSNTNKSVYTSNVGDNIANEFFINGFWYFKLDTSDSPDAQFDRSSNNKYADNQTQIVQEMELHLWFSQNYGIYKTSGKIFFNDQVYVYYRDLIRSHIK